MNWHNFFNDLEKWMQASNTMLQREGLSSDKYWQWMIGTLNVIEQRCNHNPLVVKFLATIVDYQEKQYNKLHEEDKND